MTDSEVSYNNNPSKKAKGRILYDIAAIEKNKKILNNIEGLYFSFNIDKVFDTKYYMLIIGPDDTPYEGGFYFFEARYPDEYPFYPMTMKSLTQGGDIRKHPNLYACGKCCFSFLGTWQGPPWTAVQNPQTVGISMRSVLSKNPINNEPGYENRNDSLTELYEKLIEYFNIRYGVIEIMDKLNIKNEQEFYGRFKKDIEIIFTKYYTKYLKTIEKFKDLDGKLIESPVYGFTVLIEYKFLKKRILDIKTNLDKNTNDYEI